MTPLGWLVAFVVAGLVVGYLWSVHLEHRADQVDEAVKRHPARGRKEGEDQQ